MIHVYTPTAPATSARVRDAEITLRFMSSQDNSHPIIKAITPTSMGVGPTTSVENSYSTTAVRYLSRSIPSREPQTDNFFSLE